MRSTPWGLTEFLVIALILGAASVVTFNALSSEKGAAVRATDELDPNDCSRGIDESNQESCEQGVW